MTKDQHLMLVFEESFQHTIQKGKLPACFDEQMWMSRPDWTASRGINRLAKEKRMVDVLSVVHLGVGLAQGAAHFNALRKQLITEQAFIN